jgi:VWFA-related protein
VWAVLAAAALAGPAAAQTPREPPRFRTSVDVTSIDVTVVDDRGKPILDLHPSDFTVRIDNAPRRVVTAEWTPLVTETGPPPPPPPEGYSSNESVSGGRLFLFVIDRPNIRFGAIQSIQRTVDEFIDRLQPSDRLAAVGIGPGTGSTPFTADRERVKRAISRMTGTNQQFGFYDHEVAITEALDIRRGDVRAFERVMSRECANQPAGLLDVCRDELLMQATMMATDSQINGEITVSSLRALLTGLAAIDAPKTLIFVSEGFPIEGQQSSVFELGRLAGLARTSVYALRLDNRMFDAADPRLPVAPVFDRMLLVEGLDTLASAARGASFTITGSGTGVFEQIESELSGYYMLGIESAPDDKNGVAHAIRVDVSRRGATVRSRRILKTDADDLPSRSPRAAVASALSTPLPLSGLPLKVGAFSLLGPERGKIQMLIHADIGNGYTSSQPVALAYHITDPDGRLVDAQAMDARLPPVMQGVPSPLQYVVGASLPPGDYIFKLAAVDGDKVGSVEHAFRAGLSETSDVRFSDLMVGGPIDTREMQRPSVSHLVSFGNVHGYMEIYGADLTRLAAKFEVAAAAEGPALADRDVAPYRVGDSRVIFSEVMLTRQLPPGPYFLRAVISDVSGAAQRVVKTLTRGFEVAAPPVLMTSASGAAAASIPMADVYLPVEEQMLARPFARLDALRPDVVSRFRDRVAPASLPAFNQGISALSAGDYGRAEQSFKAAVSVDADSTPILTYLAAVFAAAGHDGEAAGAWQTALIDGSDIPEIYIWLGDALLRSHELAQARTILEEAMAQWPDDPRFAKPLALTYATFGQGREAVLMLERHLTAHPEDRDALMLAVEWLYHLKVLGTTAHSRAEDQALARRYADAYLKEAKGQQAALVRQWLAFLEGNR